MRETRKCLTIKIWSKENIKFLRLNYQDSDWDYLLENLKPLTKSQIIEKASRLNISRKNQPFSKYTKEEIQILTDNYDKMSTKELIKKFFPYRTESSIASKANKLGLSSRIKWTDEDNNLLREIYANLLNEDIKNTYFPERSVSAIQSQADKLGLKKYQCRREYTEEELIDSLIKFSEKLGRTPSSDDITADKGMPGCTTYHRYFGSYSRACKEAGLPLNGLSLFGKDSHYLSSKGDICLSKAELAITEAFINNNIDYIKEVHYKDIVLDSRCGEKRCDWLVNNEIIVEYFGMPEKDYYKKKMNLKIDICNDNNLNLVSLFKKDLKDINKIIEKIKTLTRQNP